MLCLHSVDVLGMWGLGICGLRPRSFAGFRVPGSIGSKDLRSRNSNEISWCEVG